MTRLLAAALFLSPMIAAAPAMAQEVPTGSISVTGGVDLLSDYRFRGVSLSDGKVAIQPMVTVSHDSGLYLGGWGSNIDDSPVYGDVELNIYGGYATEIAPGTEIDAGITYYWYPGGDKTFGPSDYAEGALRLSYMLGPIEATGSVAYAWDQAALGSDDGVYLSLGLSSGVPGTPVTIATSIGYTDGALALGSHYLDWSVGASAPVGPVTMGVKYVDTDIGKTGVKAIDRLYDATLLFSIGVGF